MQTKLFAPPPPREAYTRPVTHNGEVWSVYEVYFAHAMEEIAAPSIRKLIESLQAQHITPDTSITWTKIVNKQSGDFLTRADYDRMMQDEQALESSVKAWKASLIKQVKETEE